MSTSERKQGPGRPRDVPLSDFGKRLRELVERSPRFGTREAFRKELNLAPATLRRYEIGETPPPSDVLERMATALGTSTDFLLTGADRTPALRNDLGAFLEPAQRYARALVASHGADRIPPQQRMILRELIKTHPVFVAVLEAENERLPVADRSNIDTAIPLMLGPINVAFGATVWDGLRADHRRRLRALVTKHPELETILSDLLAPEQ